MSDRPETVAVSRGNAGSFFFAHVNKKEEIDLSTVSLTRRGAMVRRIYDPSEAVYLTSTWSDDDVRKEYAKVSNGGRIECLLAYEARPPSQQQEESYDEISARVSKELLRVIHAKEWEANDPEAHPSPVTVSELETARFEDGMALVTIRYMRMNFVLTVAKFLSLYRPVIKD